jgi:sensor domain CHASE-containing protein
MFSAEDLPIWVYILTIAVGSAMFMHRQRQDNRDLQRRLAALESRMQKRFDDLQRELRPNATESRSRFKLVRSSLDE